MITDAKRAKGIIDGAGFRSASRHRARLAEIVADSGRSRVESNAQLSIGGAPHRNVRPEPKHSDIFLEEGGNDLV